MNYQEILKTEQDNYSKMLADCKMFFAFGSEQLEEGLKKLNLPKGEKLANTGFGGYIPLYNKDKYLKTKKKNKELFNEKIALLKQDKEASAKAIEYELSNHECYYTGDISDVVELFAGCLVALKYKEFTKILLINTNKYMKKPKFRVLSDEQYAQLKSIASARNIVLSGYQAQGGGILLNNSKCNTIWGASHGELVIAINKA